MKPSRRAVLEDRGYGLSRADWRRVDCILQELGLSGESADSVEMILVGLVVGATADTVARTTGLNRDKFIRPRAQRLREAGIWSQGRTCIESHPDEEDGAFATELLLMALVADGLVQKVDS